jgi:FAD/FMN-containing dehydrogenase
VLLSHNGPIAEGERVLAPARTFGAPIADLVQPMPYGVRQTLLDAGFAQHGVQRYWKSAFATAIGDEMIEILVEGAAEFPSPLSSVGLYPIHGASTRVATEATAYALREPLWDVNVIAQWLDPAASGLNVAGARHLWARVEPLTIGAAYTNHIAGDDRPERVRASYGRNYEKLVALKTKYDPTNLFRLNPNVRPSA